eukprot:COSAG01_NODE_35633_length_529_cov_0.779070_1_plen_59_part_00
MDLSGDGQPDAMGYDTTGDGRIDALDTNGDGQIDSKILAMPPKEQIAIREPTNGKVES